MTFDFLVPSRGRHKRLAPLIANLIRTTSDKDKVRVLFRFDNDDRDSINTFRQLEELSQAIPIKAFRGQRGRGYYDLHKFYNELGEISNADWLVLWNDNVMMSTRHWDKLIRSRYNPAFACIVAGYCRPPHSDYPAFPFISRAAYKALGHISLYPLCDSYLWHVWNPLKRAFRDADLKHIHENDESEQTTLDSTDAMRVLSPKFYQKEVQELIAHTRRSLVEKGLAL